MARPYWSGQIQISLVSFGVKLFVATEAASQISFHQIDRNTGERVRHQNVVKEDAASERSSESPVDRSDIVKGYEYRKGEYVTIEPDEIAKLRIPSKRTIEIEQFVDVSEIDPGFFEKPYFVVPENETQGHAFAVIRKALLESGKAGLGEVAFAGREHLIALMPPSDEKELGLMAYSLRYGAELRDAAQYFSDIKDEKVDSDQLSLAKELIQRKTAKFDPSKFKDDYEAALKKLVEAKVKHEPLPVDEEAPKRSNVINLMDALRRSVGEGKAGSRKPPAASHERKPVARASTKKPGPKLVRPASKRRKTA